MFTIESHPFSPFIPKDPKVLILGTFPPKRDKWSIDFYYPNWINDMWRIMGIIFFNNKDYFCDINSHTFKLDQIKTFLERQHIALHDTASKVIRLKDNASDKYLEIKEEIDLSLFLNNNNSLRAIITTGEKAASVIASLTLSKIPEMGKFKIIKIDNRNLLHFRMPSSSRAYPMKLELKAQKYKEMFLNLDYDLSEKY